MRIPDESEPHPAPSQLSLPKNQELQVPQRLSGNGRLPADQAGCDLTGKLTVYNLPVSPKNSKGIQKGRSQKSGLVSEQPGSVENENLFIFVIS